MPTAHDRSRTRHHEPHTYETLGRVMTLLCHTPGPLAEVLALRLWPTLTGDGYVLSWRGVTPSEDEVAEYLLSAADDDEWTQTLGPGDVRVEKACHCTLVAVRGVAFQLRPEPMLQPDVLTAMSRYWRTGELASRR